VPAAQVWESYGTYAYTEWEECSAVNIRTSGGLHTANIVLGKVRDEFQFGETPVENKMSHRAKGWSGNVSELYLVFGSNTDRHTD